MDELFKKLNIKLNILDPYTSAILLEQEEIRHRLERIGLTDWEQVIFFSRVKELPISIEMAIRYLEYGITIKQFCELSDYELKIRYYWNI